MGKYRVNMLSGLLISVFVGDCIACEVPVYRYALERWPTEQYLLEIDTTGENAGRIYSTVDFLNSTARESGGLTNLDLKLGNVSEHSGASAVLSYGMSDGQSLAVWSGELTEGAARRIVDSPLRRKIAERLGEGQNAVWVVILSGNSERDEAALSTLEHAIAELESRLTLPEAVREIDGEGLPELKIDFSLLELSREDPDEEIFAAMLIAGEPDLKNYSDQPIAFPVFGRGRVLYALVGEGIDRNNIRDACAFLVGPCACEIKELSPGMDLLITADWNRLAGGSWVDRVTGGPLTSLAAVIGYSRRNVTSGPVRAKIYSVPLISITAAVLIVLLAVGIISLRIIKSATKRDE